MELLVVIGILVILAIMILLVLNPMTQIKKAHDGKRKADLVKFRNALEDYYNDHNCYPNELDELAPDYMSQVPTDPSPSQSYAYSRPDCDTYRIYVSLEYEQDPTIAEAGCESGCGPGGGTEGGICTYNYGACSPNAELESCASCFGINSCQGAECNDLNPESYDCRQWFCDANCGGKCSDPAYHCVLK